MIYFTSDTHWGHKNIIEYCQRPYASVDEMNLALFKNWNETVSDEDEVYFLGDLSLNYKKNMGFISQLKGKKKFLPGNHDDVFPFGRDNAKHIQVFKDLGWEVFDKHILEMNFGGIDFVLCHFPYSGDSGYKERYAELRPKDEGKYLLHGHVHEAFKHRNKMINVGVDVWDYRPVSIDEILAYIRLIEIS